MKLLYNRFINFWVIFYQFKLIHHQSRKSWYFFYPLEGCAWINNYKALLSSSIYFHLVQRLIAILETPPASHLSRGCQGLEVLLDDWGQGRVWWASSTFGLREEEEKQVLVCTLDPPKHSTYSSFWHRFPALLTLAGCPDLRQRGWAVSKSCSLISFDCLSLCSLVTPQQTTSKTYCK